MNDELTDWRGHIIKVGTEVAYPVKAGNSPGIKAGVVTEIGDDYVKVNPSGSGPFSRNWSDKPRTLRFPTIKNLVVLPRTNHEASNG